VRRRSCSVLRGGTHEPVLGAEARQRGKLGVGRYPWCKSQAAHAPGPAYDDPHVKQSGVQK
jgi:hypothetical protein